MDAEVPKDLVAREMGRRLRLLREGRDMTQRQLAIASGWRDDLAGRGYTPSAIAMWEQGRRRIRHEEAEWLGKFFAVPAAYLLAAVDEQEAAVLDAMRKRPKPSPKHP